MKKILFFVLTSIFYLNSAQVSTKISQIIKPLESYKSFYALNTEPAQIEEKLYKYATNDELYYLSNNGINSYIKACVVKVLSQKSDPRLIQVFKNSLKSQETILYTTECLSSKQQLSSYIFEMVLKDDNLSENDKEKLKTEMVNLIFSSNNIKLLEEVRYQIPANNETYLKLRQQVIETKSEELLIALAKYKNQNDIELIKSFGEKSFLAIEEFPDEKFIPFLAENIQYSTKFPFMFALSVFCNDDAKKIIDNVIELKKEENKKNNCGNGCLSTLYQQIYKNKCVRFYESLENLWLTDKIISFDIIDNFEKSHSKLETENFIMKGFENSGEPEIIINNMYDMENVMENLTSNLTYDKNLRLIKLLNKVKGFSGDSYNKAIRNSLEFVDDLDTDILISKLDDNLIILKNKDVLLDKLKNNKSAYGLLSIMDGIKLLNDKNLFEQGAKIVIQRKNEFLRYSIWEESYKDFIRVNKLYQ